jgi:hypothetical protein
LYEVYSLRLWVNDFLQGPPLAGKYDMGALCMHEHSEKLEALLNDALDKGAEIVARGSFGHIGEDAVDQYFPPTVIVNVNHSMRLMQEEVAKLAIFSVFTLPLFYFGLVHISVTNENIWFISLLQVLEILKCE